MPAKAEPLRLPCGQCIGCRLDRSRHWATRCMHEARMHDQNSFITLTYDEDHLPLDGSLVLPHWQNFMKKLRHVAAEFTDQKLKFFHCGEYGEQFKRPHYHALIFGFDFADRRLWKVSNDITVYTSAALDALWGQGFCTVGDVTWESAAYCARYTLKKVNGPLEKKPSKKTGLLPYERIHRFTGEVIEVEKEYCTMSRRPGLGAKFYADFGADIYPHDECIVNGQKTRPPRYYDNLYERDDPVDMERIREERIRVMQAFMPDNTRARLSDKRKVKEAQTSQLIREVE